MMPPILSLLFLVFLSFHQHCPAVAVFSIRIHVDWRKGLKLEKLPQILPSLVPGSRFMVSLSKMDANGKWHELGGRNEMFYTNRRDNIDKMALPGDWLKDLKGNGPRSSRMFKAKVFMDVDGFNDFTEYKQFEFAHWYDDQINITLKNGAENGHPEIAEIETARSLHRQEQMAREYLRQNPAHPLHHRLHQHSPPLHKDGMPPPRGKKIIFTAFASHQIPTPLDGSNGDKIIVENIPHRREGKRPMEEDNNVQRKGKGTLIAEEGGSNGDKFNVVENNPNRREGKRSMEEDNVQGKGKGKLIAETENEQKIGTKKKKQKLGEDQLSTIYEEEEDDSDFANIDDFFNFDYQPSDDDHEGIVEQWPHQMAPSGSEGGGGEGMPTGEQETERFGAMDAAVSSSNHPRPILHYARKKLRQMQTPQGTPPHFVEMANGPNNPHIPTTMFNNEIVVGENIQHAEGPKDNAKEKGKGKLIDEEKGQPIEEDGDLVVNQHLAVADDYHNLFSYLHPIINLEQEKRENAADGMSLPHLPPAF